MRKSIFIVAALISFAMSTNTKADGQLPAKLEILKKHYAEHITAIEDNFIIFKDGKKIRIDDGIKKDHQQKLKQADIEDMLSQNYPVGKCNDGKMTKDNDPGRIRNDEFFRQVFASTKSQAEKHLKTIDWFGEKLKVTSNNNAHMALIKVREELARYKNLRKYLTPSAGTFNWRNIAGTKRLSVHSFAAAIDINVKYAAYWRWAGGKPGQVKPFGNKIPKKIIEIFEKHGFIWGGKWYHYDTMHFEYRPALIEIGKQFKTNC